MRALSGLFRSRGLGAPGDQWWPLVTQAADDNGLDPALVMAVLMAESSGNPNPPHRPGDGWGLMQVTPVAARQITWRDWAPDDLLDPTTNVNLGAAYLRYLVDLYGGNVEAAVNAYRAGTPTNTPLSQSYVARVFGYLESLVSPGIATAAPSSDAVSEAPSDAGGPLGSLAGLTAWIGAHWPWLVAGTLTLLVLRRR